MDHRVSKDMISSGMTPSGEKTQADLGKTQYGSAPSPNRLMDAYHSMYQNQKEETLDEKMGGLGKVPAPGPAKLPKPQDPATSKPSKPSKPSEPDSAPARTKPVAFKDFPKPKTEVFRGNVVNSETGEPIRKASTIE